MGRLIDEQTVNEAVRKVLRKYGFSDELCVSDEIWDCIENEVPTAYDVEKVVEQLEKTSDHYECEEQGREDVYMVDLVDAIEIIKGGGVDEN